jgi:hypothetical protein
MKLKTLREKLAVTSYQHDNAEVEAEFNLVQFSYTGTSKQIERLKVVSMKLSKRKLILVCKKAKS